MKVIVLVDKLGNTQTIVKGIAGPSCRDVSRFLEANIGTVVEDVPTEEYSMASVMEEVQDATTQRNELRQIKRFY